MKRGALVLLALGALVLLWLRRKSASASTAAASAAPSSAAPSTSAVASAAASAAAPAPGFLAPLPAGSTGVAWSPMPEMDPARRYTLADLTSEAERSFALVLIGKGYTEANAVGQALGHAALLRGEQTVVNP